MMTAKQEQASLEASDLAAPQECKQMGDGEPGNVYLLSKEEVLALSCLTDTLLKYSIRDLLAFSTQMFVGWREDSLGKVLAEQV